MTTLDDDFGYIDPATVKPWPIALRYGGIAAVVLIIVGLLTHIMGINDYEAAGAGETSGLARLIQFLNYAVWIGAIVMAIKAHRDQDLGGFISFGRGFFTGFATSLILALISAVWTFVFFNLIAPDALDLMMEGAMEAMSEEEAEQAGAYIEMFMNSGFMTAIVFFSTLITGSIISLIASAIMKKEQPGA